MRCCSRVGQVTRQVLAEHAVKQEQSAYDRQRHTQDAPCRFKHEQHDSSANEEIGQGRIACSLREIGLEDPLVEGQAKAAKRNDPVVPGDAGLRFRALYRWVEQEGEQQQEADVKVRVTMLVNGEKPATIN